MIQMAFVRSLRPAAAQVGPCCSFGIYAPWRLQAYGYTLAAFYAVCVLYMYYLGVWLLSKNGIPVYLDFTNMYVTGWQALHGDAISVYDPIRHLNAQDELVGKGNSLFAIWPYPPTYFLLLAPLAMLPYLVAFLSFEVATLLGCILVVYRIVQRRPAIALVLASPFTVWNFAAGQSGFLTASLVGAALVLLERAPVAAGAFIGCLTYKPQFGILFPVALLAGREWRAFGSAAITAFLLAGASIAIFGIGPWLAFPDALAAQSVFNLSADPQKQWGLLQSVYGLVRYLNGGTSLAWIGQGVISCGVAVGIWFVWRSRVSYSMKAAILSAGVLIVTPYVLAPDLAAITIPVAFIVSHQMRTGWVRGEQIIMLALFFGALLILFASGRSLLGAPITLILFGLSLRRALLCDTKPVASAAAI